MSTADFGGEIRLYNTGIRTPDYERLQMRTDSNVFYLDTTSGGGGTDRDLVIGTADGAVRYSAASNIVRWYISGAAGSQKMFLNTTGLTLYGNYLPQGDLTRNLGSPSARFAIAYTHEVSGESIYVSGAFVSGVTLGDYIPPDTSFVLYNDNGTLKFDGSAVNTDTQLTTEQVQDIAGPLVATGGTKTLITVTYQDSTNDMDFVVDNDLANYSNTNSQFLTEHPTISAASSSDNSGRTYIQDVLLDSNGHVTGLATATETVTQLTTEEVQDIAGPLVATGGTKTGITITYQDSTNDMDFVVGGLTTSEIAAGTLVIESEGIGSNDNDTTIPTSAAVKDFVINRSTIPVSGVHFTEYEPPVADKPQLLYSSGNQLAFNASGIPYSEPSGSLVMSGVYNMVIMNSGDYDPADAEESTLYFLVV